VQHVCQYVFLKIISLSLLHTLVLNPFAPVTRPSSVSLSVKRADDVSADAASLLPGVSCRAYFSAASLSLQLPFELTSAASLSLALSAEQTSHISIDCLSSPAGCVLASYCCRRSLCPALLIETALHLHFCRSLGPVLLGICLRCTLVAGPSLWSC
jgi:hypothetical protein